jgi:O-antigen ligase
VRNGVVQLHAHNAWLDLWLQLGILGLLVFGALVLVALVRSWMLAARPEWNVAMLLPLLLVVALLVQSLAESRLLVEYGLFLLVVIAVKTKRDRADARKLITR